MSFELHSYSLRVRFSSRGDLASSKHGDLTDLGEQIGRAWLLDEYTMKIQVGDPMWIPLASDTRFQISNRKAAPQKRFASTFVRVSAFRCSYSLLGVLALT